MNWAIEMPEIEVAFKLNVQDKILMLGSCFTENIGAKFLELGMNVTINPAGSHYHAMSSFDFLDRIVANKTFTNDDIVQHQQKFYSWHHHTSINDKACEVLLNNINNTLSTVRQSIDTTDVLIITLGTAIGYTLLSNDTLVANCHKQNPTLFVKNLSTSNDIYLKARNVLIGLFEQNKTLKVLLTVSPVRYIKDGLVDNNRSKAQLIEAIRLLQKCFSNVFYFPAYEVIIDVLRDYRFYKEDKVHPTNEAITELWHWFVSNYFTDHHQHIIKEISKLNRACSHQSDTFIGAFIQKNEALLQTIQNAAPTLNLSKYRTRLTELKKYAE